MNTKIIKITFPLFLLIILFSFYINAFAVSMPYLEGKTIVLYPGASSDFELVLQNMVGDTDETAAVTIDEGNEIAKITDKKNVYEVPKGTKDTVVHLKISIPIDAPLGKEWTVRFKATPITEKEGGMVQISGGVSDYFKVRAGNIPEQLPKEKTATSMLWWLGGIVIALVAVIFLLTNYMKKKRK